MCVYILLQLLIFLKKYLYFHQYIISTGCINQVSYTFIITFVYTDLVIASTGDDKKISLWQKNGQNMGNLSVSKVDISGTIVAKF